MNLKEINGQLGEIENMFSPKVRESGIELMQKVRIKSEDPYSLRLRSRISNEEKRIHDLEVLSFFPRSREVIDEFLVGEKERVKGLQREFDAVQSSRRERQRQKNLSAYTARIEALEIFADYFLITSSKGAIEKMKVGDKIKLKEKLRALKEAVFEAYSNGSSAIEKRYINLFRKERPPLPQRIEGMGVIGFDDMEQDIMDYFINGSGTGVFVEYPEEITRGASIGEDFCVSFYLGQAKMEEVATTINFDLSHLKLKNPKYNPLAFRFPRNVQYLGLDVSFVATTSYQRDWVGMEDARAEKKYVGYGLEQLSKYSEFLPGKIVAGIKYENEKPIEAIIQVPIVRSQPPPFPADFDKRSR